eukprot:CAMPEP_0168396384 /NCGR_PEP_ID=MMETSP0228-20121227/20521_1 /TAXON_ID=133427 /ORGANISM="Protoceratium reticulatum, Strain CCCM 535 (=CCMP 1889)" /LENGTH=98 /DNA_ID=CAMNT_0008409825 /DNA_START=165 /DNA_END=459 /DNA_ORIENTATION=+
MSMAASNAAQRIRPTRIRARRVPRQPPSQQQNTNQRQIILTSAGRQATGTPARKPGASALAKVFEPALQRAADRRLAQALNPLKPLQAFLGLLLGLPG